jgi:hypothetical protein
VLEVWYRILKQFLNKSLLGYRTFLYVGTYYYGTRARKLKVNVTMRRSDNLMYELSAFSNTNMTTTKTQMTRIEDKIMKFPIKTEFGGQKNSP